MCVLLGGCVFFTMGLLVFILYLPGGLAELLHRFGDLVTDGVSRLRRDGERGPGHDVADARAVAAAGGVSG